MTISDLCVNGGLSKYGKELYYLIVAKYSDEKLIDNMDFSADEVNYILKFIKNVEKTPRLDSDIEGFIKIMKYLSDFAKPAIHISDSDMHEVMDILCTKYNYHFDKMCDFISLIKGYYYNKGNLSGISNLIDSLHEKYLNRVLSDKKSILEVAKEYNKNFQNELIKLYLYDCFSVKKIINNLPSKNIIDLDYKVMDKKIGTPLCVTLYKEYLSGNCELSNYPDNLGDYKINNNSSVRVPYTKKGFLDSICIGKQKIINII